MAWIFRGIYSTGASMLWKNKATLEDIVKHTETPVTTTMNLTEGDHISLSRQDLPFKHAIVVETIKSPTDKVKVAYHSGSKATALVQMSEVELHQQAKNGQLLRHRYDPLICYSSDRVVARARSLCCPGNPADDAGGANCHWSFFSSDEHFANWCQIVFKFGDETKKNDWKDDYESTTVTSVHRFSEGDHIVTDDGHPGIVIKLGVDDGDRQILHIARFPSEDQRGPFRTTVVINENKRLTRYDYDIALGVRGHTAKEKAVAEVDRPPERLFEPMPYDSGQHFAVWCKTSQSSTIDCRVLCDLASARMKGRVWARISDMGGFNPGDHVAFKPNASSNYYQHAIVCTKNEGRFTVIYLNTSGNARSVDKSTYVDTGWKYKFFYDVREKNKPDDVVARAQSLFGLNADELPFKDPQHFAMWCKTNSYQLHN